MEYVNKHYKLIDIINYSQEFRSQFSYFLQKHIKHWLYNSVSQEFKLSTFIIASGATL